MATGDSCMMRRVASAPSICGITRSMRTTSGRSARQRRTASSPSWATQATSWRGSLRTTRRSVSTAICWSLTMPTRISRLSDQFLDDVEQPVVVEAALGQVVVGARLQTAEAVLLAVLVRHDDHRYGV